MTTSNVYTGTHNSWIYCDGKLVKHVPGAETLADPVLFGGKLMYASEHSEAWQTDGVTASPLPVGGPNQWSISAGRINNKPVAFFNRRFNGQFSDGSVAIDLRNGQNVWKISGPGFVRDFAGECATVGWNNGRENFQCINGTKHPSTILSVARVGGKYIGVGDIRYGYNRGASGRIAEWTGNGWENFGNTGSRNAMQINSDGRRSVVCSVEPARLTVVDGRKVDTIWTGSGGQGGRSFGAACDIKGDRIVAAFTMGGKVHVFVATQ